AATWSNNLGTPGALVDLGSDLARSALPRAPFFDNPTRVNDSAAYRGLAVTPDGRYAVTGVRNMSEVVKIDLATMTAVAGLDVAIEADAGATSDCRLDPSGRRFYCVVNDGMHTGNSRATEVDILNQIDRPAPSAT